LLSILLPFDFCPVLPSTAKMSSQEPIPVETDDSDNNSSRLTTARSGNTPTLPSDETPGLQKLWEKAADDAAYMALIASIPRENKYHIQGATYIKVAPYRVGQPKKTAWYMKEDQCEELIATQGTCCLILLHIILVLTNINKQYSRRAKGRETVVYGSASIAQRYNTLRQMRTIRHSIFSTSIGSQETTEPPESLFLVRRTLMLHENVYGRLKGIHH
jgi:hypothetical protein